MGNSQMIQENSELIINIKCQAKLYLSEIGGFAPYALAINLETKKNRFFNV
jgi:hypothetical protein